MYIYIYVYVYVYTRIYIHKYKHTYIYGHVIVRLWCLCLYIGHDCGEPAQFQLPQICCDASRRVQSQGMVCMTFVYMRVKIQIKAHAHTHAQRYRRTSARARSHTHKHTHTHTHSRLAHKVWLSSFSFCNFTGAFEAIPWQRWPTESVWWFWGGKLNDWRIFFSNSRLLQRSHGGWIGFFCGQKYRSGPRMEKSHLKRHVLLETRVCSIVTLLKSRILRLYWLYLYR